MAAEGLITLDELKVKLAGLEELRETARWELDALSCRREKIEELERDKDALLETYVGMVPAALDSLTPEEHHYVYKMLRLRVALRPDAPPEVSGMFGGDLDISNTETASYTEYRKRQINRERHSSHSRHPEQLVAHQLF